MAIKITEEIVKKAEAYVSARLRAEVCRDFVDEISREILGEKTWPNESTGCRIADPKQVWAMSDKDKIEYFGRLRTALSDAGFRLRTPSGQPNHCFLCPAREAERKAERARTEMVVIVLRAAGENPDKYFPRKSTLEWIEAYDRFAAGIVRAVNSHKTRNLPAPGAAPRPEQPKP